MATQGERIKELEETLDKVVEYLEGHVLSPLDSNKGLVKRRKKL